MSTVNCLIIDDEPIARDIIKSHIGKVANWAVVGSWPLPETLSSRT